MVRLRLDNTSNNLEGGDGSFCPADRGVVQAATTSSLLDLGGRESVDNLRRVKIREHIALIAEMVGGV
ncbi:MAG: DUF1851 domain-containing protein [Atopobiaceae bacterium]|nr:DUF1851 domain-containing protein [Atopobiaceae bacterium]